MKKQFINFLIISLLNIGCGTVLSHIDSPVILHTEYEGKHSFNLKNIKNTTVAFLPFRGTLGGYISNKTVRTRLCQQLIKNIPSINYIQSGQLIALIASQGPDIIGQYNNLMERYLVRGRLKPRDLAIFSSAGIDYLACISLNGIVEDNPRRFLFLLSLQIWEVDTGKMVWDITQEGQMYVAFNDDENEVKKEVMTKVTDFVLAKLSG